MTQSPTSASPVGLQSHEAMILPWNEAVPPEPYENKAEEKQAPTFVKHDAEKTQYHHTDPDFEGGLAAVLSYGAAKYSPDNWKNCKQPWARYYSALRRHLAAIQRGETADVETGLSHCYHAACCLMFIAYFERRGILHNGGGTGPVAPDGG